jgi:hypothetical protein
MWIEILKIVGPSALVAVVLAYVFNKKLENHKMLLKVNEQSLLLMINGLHLLMKDYKAIVLKVGEVRRLIEKDKYPEEQIDELDVLKQQYESTLKGHRIYLAPLIPYSKTGGTFHSYDDVNLGGVNLLLNRLRKMQIAVNPISITRHRDEALKFIDYVDLSYESACYRANQIIAQMQNGKSPFNVRWGELSLPEWQVVAPEMHRKCLSLEFEN